MSDVENGWPEYQRLVLAQLEECRTRLASIEKRLRHIELDVGGLKIRATVWGAIAGGIPVAIFWMLNNV